MRLLILPLSTSSTSSRMLPGLNFRSASVRLRLGQLGAEIVE